MKHIILAIDEETLVLGRQYARKYNRLVRKSSVPEQLPLICHLILW
jgi:hypothetical protein